MEPTAICVATVSMAGSTTLTPHDFAAYLGQLLGHPVAFDDWVRLSSGQQARVGGWLTERGAGIGDLRKKLSVAFQPATLIDVAGSQPQPPSAAAPRHLRLDAAVGHLCVGIDIQRIDELLPDSVAGDPKTLGEITAIFTLREISYAQSRPTPAQTLGGLFAAKEALRKCDPALLALPLPDVEILPDESGRPQFPGYSLSISHSGGFAIAVAAALSGRHTHASPIAPNASFDLSTPQISPPATMKRFMIKTAIVTVALLLGLMCLQWLGALRLPK
jgi:phosphopantetheinyl transferase (holo-ACP synthase)